MLKKLKHLILKQKNLDSKRTPRVALSHLKDVSFQIVSPVNHKVGISNLSTAGFGLKINLDKKWQQVGVVLTGHLLLNQISVKMSCQVRHVTGLTVGCEFLARTHGLESSINNFLSSEVSSLGLRRVNKNIMKEPADWFIDGLGNELYIEKSSDNRIVYFYANFLSNWIEWRVGSEPKFGYVLKPDGEQKPLVKPTDLVKLFEAPPPGIENLFTKFLESVAELPDTEKHQLVQRLVA